MGNGPDPVRSAVGRIGTTRTFLGRNLSRDEFKEFVERIDLLLRNRIDEYVSTPAATGRHHSVIGSHAEIVALDNAIKYSRAVGLHVSDDLSEFVIANVWLRSSK